MATTAVIITGAGPITPTARDAVPDDALVIAADAGLDRAREVGLEPQLVVGDLDSISHEGRAWTSAHATLVGYPADKDATDTELAVDVALRHAPRRLLLIGNDDGTRLDHTFGAVGVLGQHRLAGLQLDGWWGDTRLAVAHGGHPVRLDVPTAAVISLVALHGPASGVRVTGVRWELNGVELDPLSGHGISNEVTAPPVVASCAAGVVTVFVSPSYPITPIDPTPPGAST